MVNLDTGVKLLLSRGQELRIIHCECVRICHPGADWRTVDRPTRLADNGQAYQTGRQWKGLADWRTIGVSAVFVRQATLGIDQQVAMIYANIAGTVLGLTRVQNNRKYRYRY